MAGPWAKRGQISELRIIIDIRHVLVHRVPYIVSCTVHLCCCAYVPQRGQFGYFERRYLVHMDFFTV